MSNAERSHENFGSFLPAIELKKTLCETRDSYDRPIHAQNNKYHSSEGQRGSESKDKTNIKEGRA